MGSGVSASPPSVPGPPAASPETTAGSLLATDQLHMQEGPAVSASPHFFERLLRGCGAGSVTTAKVPQEPWKASAVTGVCRPPSNLY